MTHAAGELWPDTWGPGELERIAADEAAIRAARSETHADSPAEAPRRIGGTLEAFARTSAPAKRNAAPEATLSLAIRKHLAKVHKALPTRVNSGRIQQDGRTIQMAEAGTADVLACVPFEIAGMVLGIYAAFEVKAPGNGPTQMQEKFLGSVLHRGGIAAVVRSTDDVDRVIEQARAELAEWVSRSVDSR